MLQRLLIALFTASLLFATACHAAEMTPEQKKAQEDPLREWRLKPCREAEGAAAHGGGREMTTAGYMSLNYQHCPQNYERSLYWFQKAIDINYPLGFYYLGTMYRDGTGVEKDEKKGFDLIKKFTTMPDTSSYDYKYAWEDVSRMYINGIGTSKNLTEAYYAATRAYLINAAELQRTVDLLKTTSPDIQPMINFKIDFDKESVAKSKDALAKLKLQLSLQQTNAVDARIARDTTEKP